MNEVDLESLENDWGFLFKKGAFSKIYRKSIKESHLSVITHTPLPEKLVILVYAFEKFENLVCK